MTETDMLDTQYLFQPRGQGTGWCFRMVTPPALVGKTNPRTEKPYGKEIRVGLKTHVLSDARKARDILLGSIRQQENEFLGWCGSIDEAVDFFKLAAPRNDTEKKILSGFTAGVAKAELEPRIGPEKAKLWHKAASGKATPISFLAEKFTAECEGKKSKSYINNFKTVLNELYEFGGKLLAAEDVERSFAASFVTEFLPNRKSPKAPNGQGPATIRKKVSNLAAFWKWAQKRGHLPYSKETPWDEQAPDSSEVKAAAKKFRPFTAGETQKLLEAAPPGKPIGDIIRVALLTGVRLEEVASLTASQVDPEARWYEVRDGKTENAARLVPLVGFAQSVILTRLKKASDINGPLFPELKERASTGRRGGAISQAFTRLRREVLGEHTDDELKQHSFRHLWRTAARRAGVDLRTTQEMGGWSRGKSSDLTYDHGEEIQHYRDEQAKVLRWFEEQGFLGKEKSLPRILLRRSP